MKNTRPCNPDVPRAERTPGLLTDGPPASRTKTYSVNPFYPFGIRDEIRCEVPLPGRESPEHTRFYTTSCPDPRMRRYTITAAGRLIDDNGNDREPDGYIEFYTRDKIRGVATADGCTLRQYRAEFSAGQLQTITHVSNNEEEAYYELSSFRWFGMPAGRAKRRRQRRQKPGAPSSGTGSAERSE